MEPVGVFDSGLGGLTIVREIRRRLPHESVVYFGDVARLPYGIKSKKQIQRFSIENTRFLLKHRIKALVIACNSSSSAAYTLLKRTFRIPTVDVMTPAVEDALYKTRSGRVGIIGTQATIDSGAYAKALRVKNPAARVYSVACPLFVPLVETGWNSGKITREIITHYLAPLKKRVIDTLILG